MDTRIRIDEDRALTVQTYENPFPLPRSNGRELLCVLTGRGASFYIALQRKQAVELLQALQGYITWHDEPAADDGVPHGVGPEIEPDEEEAYRERSHADVDTRVP